MVATWAILLLVFFLVFLGLMQLAVPWWGALIGALLAWFPISNQLGLWVTRIRRPLAAYTEASPLDASVSPRIEAMAITASWGEEQDRQLEELVHIADGALAASAIGAIQQLKEVLTKGEQERSWQSYVVILLLTWKVAPQSPTVADTRNELLAIAADVRRSEVQPA